MPAPVQRAPDVRRQSHRTTAPRGAPRGIGGVSGARWTRGGSRWTGGGCREMGGGDRRRGRKSQRGLSGSLSGTTADSTFPGGYWKPELRVCTQVSGPSFTPRSAVHVLCPGSPGASLNIMLVNGVSNTSPLGGQEPMVLDAPGVAQPYTTFHTRHSQVPSLLCLRCAGNA